MIYFPETVGQLRRALADFADDVRVVTPDTHPPGVGSFQVEFVFLDVAGLVVGTDAEDHRPQPGERAALLFSSPATLGGWLAGYAGRAATK